MSTPPLVPDDADSNPWKAPAAAEARPPDEIDPAALGPLRARRTTLRLVGLGFLALALMEMLVAFVAGANGRKSWGLAQFARESGLGGGAALEGAIVLTALAGSLVVAGVFHLALLAGLWRPARWARRAAAGASVVYALGSALAVPALVDRDGGLGWAAAVGAGSIGAAGHGGLALLLLSARSRSLCAPGVAAALRASPRPRRSPGRAAAAALAGLGVLGLALAVGTATSLIYIEIFMLIA